MAATRAGAASVQPVPASLMRADSLPAPSPREGGMPVLGVRVLDGEGRVVCTRTRGVRPQARAPEPVCRVAATRCARKSEGGISRLQRVWCGSVARLRARKGSATARLRAPEACVRSPPDFLPRKAATLTSLTCVLWRARR